MKRLHYRRLVWLSPEITDYFVHAQPARIQRILRDAMDRNAFERDPYAVVYVNQLRNS